MTTTLSTMTCSRPGNASRYSSSNTCVRMMSTSSGYTVSSWHTCAICADTAYQSLRTDTAGGATTPQRKHRGVSGGVARGTQRAPESTTARPRPHTRYSRVTVHDQNVVKVQHRRVRLGQRKSAHDAHQCVHKRRDAVADDDIALDDRWVAVLRDGVNDVV